MKSHVEPHSYLDAVQDAVGDRTALLANGTRVLLNTDAVVPSIAVAFRGGPLVETAATSGYTHLLEHLCFSTGIERYKLLGEIESSGAVVEAVTSKTFTFFSAYPSNSSTLVPSNPLSDTVSRCLRKVLTPRESPLSESRKELSNVLYEARRVATNPAETLNELLIYHLFRHSSLEGISLPILGSPHSLMTLSHQDLTRFKERLYAPNNCVAVLNAPQVSAEKLLADMEETLLQFSGRQRDAAFERPIDGCVGVMPFDRSTSRYALRASEINYPLLGSLSSTPKGRIFGAIAFPIENRVGSRMPEAGLLAGKLVADFVKKTRNIDVFPGIVQLPGASLCVVHFVGEPSRKYILDAIDGLSTGLARGTVAYRSDSLSKLYKDCLPQSLDASLATYNHKQCFARDVSIVSGVMTGHLMAGLFSNGTNADEVLSSRDLHELAMQWATHHRTVLLYEQAIPKDLSDQECIDVMTRSVVPEINLGIGWGGISPMN